jgi:hypothetical protein
MNATSYLTIPTDKSLTDTGKQAAIKIAQENSKRRDDISNFILNGSDAYNTRIDMPSVEQLNKNGTKVFEAIDMLKKVNITVDYKQISMLDNKDNLNAKGLANIYMYQRHNEREQGIVYDETILKRPSDKLLNTQDITKTTNYLNTLEFLDQHDMENLYPTYKNFSETYDEQQVFMREYKITKNEANEIKKVDGNLRLYTAFEPNQKKHIYSFFSKVNHTQTNMSSSFSTPKSFSIE